MDGIAGHANLPVGYTPLHSGERSIIDLRQFQRENRDPEGLS